MVASDKRKDAQFSANRWAESAFTPPIEPKHGELGNDGGFCHAGFSARSWLIRPDRGIRAWKVPDYD